MEGTERAPERPAIKAAVPVAVTAPGMDGEHAALRVSPAKVRSSELVALSGKALTWGILSLIFAFQPLASFLGIVFSRISMRYARAYASRNGRLNGRARVAWRMAKPGFIVGIALTGLNLTAALVALVVWLFKSGGPMAWL